MPKTIGCIGCGNMGGAILSGFAERLAKNDWHLCGYNRSPEKMPPLAKKGIEVMQDIAAIASCSDILIFAVKPKQMTAVLQEAAPHLRSGCVAISIAAGYPLARVNAILGRECIVCRAMPTTTAMVGRGIFAFCFGSQNLTKHVVEEVLNLFALLGYCLELPEKDFCNFSALVGAGPAYVFAVMHALQQAGVTMGFGREQCHKMISELFAGCAELAIRNPKTFMQLRDDVCSPGGLTIAGINVLDSAGMTGLFVQATEAAAKRGREMDREST